MYKKYLGLVVLVWLITVSTSQAETIQQNTATATNLGLYGGETRDIAVDPNNDYVYITTYAPNGVFISSDDGVTWHGLPANTNYGEPRGIEVHATTGQVYALLSEGLITSTDNGDSWETIGDIDEFAGTLTLRDDTLVVGRTDGQVSISLDAGVTFDTFEVEADSNINSVALTGDASEVYAVADSGSATTLYTSNDNGETWTVVDTNDITNEFITASVDPSNANLIFVTSNGEDVDPWYSSDGGASWTQTNLSGGGNLVTFDETSGRIYAGIAYSDDDGASWSALNDQTSGSRVSGLVVPDPDNSDVLFGTSFAALSKSTDGAATWTDNNTGITAVTVNDVAQSTNKETMWVATNAGLAKTSNFTADSPTWEFPIHYEYYAESVWLNPDDANNVVVGGLAAVYVTTDGGENWTTATGWEDLTVYSAGQIIQDQVDNNTLYAAVNSSSINLGQVGGVYVSGDLGLSWTSLDFPEGDAVQAIAVASDGTLYAGTGDVTIDDNEAEGIYRYDGVTWETLTDSPSQEITALAIDPTNQDHIFATAADFNTFTAEAPNGLFVTLDGGDSWDRVTTGLDNITKLKAVTIQTTTSPVTVYVAGQDMLTQEGLILKSSDGGETFAEYYRGLKSESFNTLLFDGLVTGNTRGLYNVKSKAKLALSTTITKLKHGKRVTVTLQLTDKTTGVKLHHKKIKLQKKLRGEWTTIDTARTNHNGKVVIRLTVKKATRLRAQWTPKPVDAEEYLSVTSKVRRIKLRR